MDENQVVAAVCQDLENKGYFILQKCHTKQHGIDIIAEHQVSKQKLLIEAKGGTSSREGSSRFGKAYTQSQVFDVTSKGLFTVLHHRVGNPKTMVALAVPEGRWFRHYLDPLFPMLQQLQVVVALVGQNNEVNWVNSTPNQSSQSCTLPRI